MKITRSKSTPLKKTSSLKEEEEINMSPSPDYTNSNQRKSGSKLLFLIIIAVVAYLGYKMYLNNQITSFKNKIIPNAINKIVNNPDMKIKEIINVKKKSGLYEFSLSFIGNEQAKYTSYITTDGKIVFQSGIDLSTLNAQAQTTPQPKVTCDQVNKADKAVLTAFVVADCPYGLQMQRVIKSTVGQLPQIEGNIKVRYIGSIVDGKITSMHGDKEAQENLRQICLREEQPAKYWPYVSCYMKEGKSDQCLTVVDKNKAAACASDKQRGLKYAQADFDIANKFSVGGSPTLLVNENQIVSEFDFGGRVPNAVKDIVCCGSKEKPSYCAKEISKDQLAVAYSIDDKAAAGSTSTSASGCAPQ